MSWDNFIDNTAYWLEVASNRMARRALHVEAKSLTKMSEDDNIAEWIAFLPEKSLTKTLRRDVRTILAKKLAEKAQKSEKTTSGKKDKSERVCPPEDIED